MRRSMAAVALMITATACFGTRIPETPEVTDNPNGPGPVNIGLERVVVRFDGASTGATDDASEGATVDAELADESYERAVGLMNRDSLDEDSGMLFILAGTTSSGFHMRNTRIPLSIAYMRRQADDRFEVVAILDMEPCPADDCPSYPPGLWYDTTLEVNQGWFDAAGVREGDVARTDRPMPSPGVEPTAAPSRTPAAS